MLLVYVQIFAISYERRNVGNSYQLIFFSLVNLSSPLGHYDELSTCVNYKKTRTFNISSNKNAYETREGVFLLFANFTPLPSRYTVDGWRLDYPQNEEAILECATTDGVSNLIFK